MPPTRYPTHAAVLTWAKNELGTSESPPGSNTGKRIRFYQDKDWLPGTNYAWCASFVCAAWEVGGKRKLPFPSAGAWDLGNRARKAGWAVDSPAKLVPGDIVTFRTGAGHVALFISYDARSIKTLDGNVGDQVAYRVRLLSEVRDLIHVPEKPVAVPRKTTKPPLFEVVRSASGKKVIYVSGARAVGRKLAQILKRYPSVTIRRRKPTK